jgi:hypothetical protein
MNLGHLPNPANMPAYCEALRRASTAQERCVFQGIRAYRPFRRNDRNTWCPRLESRVAPLGNPARARSDRCEWRPAAWCLRAGCPILPLWTPGSSSRCASTRPACSLGGPRAATAGLSRTCGWEGRRDRKRRGNLRPAGRTRGGRIPICAFPGLHVVAALRTVPALCLVSGARHAEVLDPPERPPIGGRSRATRTGGDPPRSSRELPHGR